MAFATAFFGAVQVSAPKDPMGRPKCQKRLACSSYAVSCGRRWMYHLCMSLGHPCPKYDVGNTWYMGNSAPHVPGSQIWASDDLQPLLGNHFWICGRDQLEVLTWKNYATRWPSPAIISGLMIALLAAWLLQAPARHSSTTKKILRCIVLTLIRGCLKIGYPVSASPKDYGFSSFCQ